MDTTTYAHVKRMPDAHKRLKKGKEKKRLAKKKRECRILAFADTLSFTLGDNSDMSSAK